ncbi:hypothetical protein ACFOZ7_09825 [Natribaculum luteum]|uniref:Uncharacterized protein n=1 Tax=Natribaculum luteum TaxID=1586232 RepID=A0ABD5NYV9_9EURY|nr:hypothetical protein [Natribaculum luteum]
MTRVHPFVAGERNVDDRSVTSLLVGDVLAIVTFAAVLASADTVYTALQSVPPLAMLAAFVAAVATLLAVPAAASWTWRTIVTFAAVERRRARRRDPEPESPSNRSTRLHWR